MENPQPLFAHQEKAIELCMRNNAYALFMDTGTGKTRTTLEIIKRRKVHTLIICPLPTLASVWVNEIALWAPEIKAINLHEILKKKEAIPIPNTHAIFLINYESLKRVPRELISKIQFIVLEESAKIRNPNAQITNLIMTLKDKPFRVELSGCPAPNSLLEYYPQIFFINHHVLGNNYSGKFRSDYYRFRATHFFNANKQGGYFLPIIKKDSKDIIANMVSKIAFQCSKKHCLDLLPQTYEKRFCNMTTEQAVVYHNLLKHNVAEFKDSIVLGANEMAKIMKLRQITSGFFINDEGMAVDLSDSKFNLLLDTLEEIGNHRVIIWCQFHREIDKIVNRFGIDRAVPYCGDQTVKEKDDNLNRFKSGSAQYLVAHPVSGGYGLNLTECCYSIYYSMSYSYEQRKQSEDRIYRSGQKLPVTYIDLLVPGTIDEVLCQVVREKKNLSDAILEMIHNSGG